MSLGRLIGRSARGPARRLRLRPAASLRRGVDDSVRSAEARRIQAIHRGWVVMWSTWHRTFTAFSYFAPVPLVLDEPTPESLVNRMREVELHYSTSRVNARYV
jgi:hypothetical protein